MTRFAQLLLVLTSLAPVALVYAALLVQNNDYWPALRFGGLAFTLVVVCVALLRWSTSSMQGTSRAFENAEAKQAEPIAFLVLYALPLLKVESAGVPWIPVLVFGALMTMLVQQQQMFFVNPLLSLLGYRFTGARNDSGHQVMIISKASVPRSGTRTFVELSSSLWLEKGDKQREQA